MKEMANVIATLGGLMPGELEETMQTLRAVLRSLPADNASNSDARLRHDLTVLLTGYDAGRPSADATAKSGKSDG